MPSRRFARLLPVLALALAFPSPARGEDGAEPLLRLVPADASLTIVVEDLRGRYRAITASPLAERLAGLPIVRDWLGSDGGKGFRLALKKAESSLGENVATIRDGLFGEGVVLVLRLPPGGRPEEAKGLLLVREPDGKLLDRIIAGLNEAQRKSGQLKSVVRNTRRGSEYYAREFRPGGQAGEYYARLDDRVFAWSNSEDLILGVIDRRAKPTAGLTDSPEFRRVRDRLPKNALASLYVDPRFVERLASATSKAQTPFEAKATAMLGRYLAAVRYAGAALEWRDGLVLHTEEFVEPEPLPPALRRWAARNEAPDPSIRRVPSSALLMASAELDFGAILDGLNALVPDPNAPKLANLRMALNGLFLGLDGRRDVVPRLRPGALLYLEGPEEHGPEGSGKLPTVFSVELAQGEGGAKIAPAIDNALKTILALHALDDKHGGGRLRVESRDVGGRKVTGLSGEAPFAFAVREGRLVVGTSAEAVARCLKAESDPHAGDRVERVRSAYFPDSVSFALADLRAVFEFADKRRPELARLLAARQNSGAPEAARDIDRALALIDLFDAGFVSTTVRGRLPIGPPHPGARQARPGSPLRGQPVSLRLKNEG